MYTRRGRVRTRPCDSRARRSRLNPQNRPPARDGGSRVGPVFSGRPPRRHRHRAAAAAADPLRTVGYRRQIPKTNLFMHNDDDGDDEAKLNTERAGVDESVVIYCC